MQAIGDQLGKDNENYRSAIYNMGATLDIVTVQLPSIKNGFVGVSLYCDANGIAKNFKPNTRATRIAHECGQKVIINGDCFISRFHDDESIPWKRLSISIDECDLSSEWIRECSKDNFGKNLSSYSSAGALSNALDNMKGTSTSEVAAKVESKLDTDGNLTWTQTLEDVEIRIKVDPSVTSKSAQIVIKSNRLMILLPTTLPNSGVIEQKLSQAESKGGELFDKVDVDESSWSLEGMGNEKTLIINLTKDKRMRWLTLLR